ncbi:MAG: hypothetical protein K5876_00240 [Ruminiclostridium sp.]|nr:hypothetical protein [Ruminiclostridium sp.]
MRREELVMDILGELGDRFVTEAMPKEKEYAVHGGSAQSREDGADISRRDLRIYMMTRALGIAAALFLAVGGIVLLVMNWDKIAVREPERPSSTTTSAVTTAPASTGPVSGNTGEDSSVSETTDIIAEPGGNSGLEYLVGSSYAVIWAKCDRLLRSDDQDTVYGITCMETLAGSSIPRETELYVSGSPYIYEESPIKEEGYFILPVVKKRAVFFDTDRYYLASDIFFVTDENGTILSAGTGLRETETGFGNVDELKRYLSDNGLIPSQSDEDIGPRVTRTDDPEEAAREAEYIVEAEITDIDIDIAEDRTSYDCLVLHRYKGADDIAENIYVAMKKHQADVGEKYILLINRASTGSLLFYISSPDTSVWRSDSPQAQMIKEYCRREYPSGDNSADTTAALSERDAETAGYLKKTGAGCVSAKPEYVTTNSMFLDYKLIGEYTDRFYLKIVYGYELQTQFSDGEWHTYDKDSAWKDMLTPGPADNIVSENTLVRSEVPFTDGGRPLKALAPGHYRVRKPVHAYSTETDAELAVFNLYAEFDITEDTPNILGLTMTVEEVSPRGVIAAVKQGNYGSDRDMGIIMSERPYSINVYSEETGWEHVFDSTVSTENVIRHGSTVKETVLWDAFAPLAPGRYSLTMTFDDTRPDGGDPYCSVTCTAEFVIPENDEASDEPPEGMIEVKQPEKTISLTVKPLLALDDVTADYDYEMIDGYENEENWQYQKKWAEETLEGERLEALRARDYFSGADYQVRYVGNERCDYVIRKQLGFTDTVECNSYEIFVFVKDGKAVGATDMLKQTGASLLADENDLFETIRNDDRMMRIDMHTFETEYITTGSWSAIADMNEDWVLVGGDTLHAYNRHTKKLLTPDAEPGINWNYGYATNLVRLNGSYIEYTMTEQVAGGYRYDLDTGETTEAPELYEGLMRMTVENSEYFARSYYNTAALNADVSDFSRVSVTRKSDGLTKVFSFRELLGRRRGETDSTYLNHLLWGDWFITRVTSYGRIAVNFVTGESAKVTDIFKENHVYGLTGFGDRYCVEYIDNETGRLMFGEIEFSVK